jgi:hypothetical protein
MIKKYIEERQNTYIICFLKVKSPSFVSAFLLPLEHLIIAISSYHHNSQSNQLKKTDKNSNLFKSPWLSWKFKQFIWSFIIAQRISKTQSITNESSDDCFYLIKMIVKLSGCVKSCLFWIYILYKAMHGHFHQRLRIALFFLNICSVNYLKYCVP